MSRAFYGGSGGGYSPSLPSDRGYLAWTQPTHVLAGVTALPTAGLLMLRRIRRVPAAPITNIVTLVGAAGATLTAGQCFAALYTPAGVLAGQTTDQATAWASNGMKAMPLSGGPYTHAGGDLYVGVWFNGTTGPSFPRSGTINATLTNAGLAASVADAASANTGVTTTAPATLGTMTATVYEWWFALS